MTKKFSMALMLVVMIGALAAGCVTTKKFETAVADMTTRVDDVQTKVETQSGRIDKLEARDGELETGIKQVGGRVEEVRGSATQAMDRAVAAEKVARGKVVWQVTLSNNDVRFGSDKYDLSESGTAALDQLVEKLKAFDRMVFVEIQGHTDNRGSEPANEILGLRRAEAVRNYLHDKGIPLNLIEVISFGEAKPVAGNNSSEGRAANRRVEVLVLE
jgi:outer membrane protein OmpA-like peptidoglycan-associated protein